MKVEDDDGALLRSQTPKSPLQLVPRRHVGRSVAGSWLMLRQGVNLATGLATAPRFRTAKRTTRR